MRPLSKKQFQAGLAAIALLFLGVVAGRVSFDLFGFYHDDALYLVSAQSLAVGEGHRAASLPGAPPQTKYPILYPLALSVVWRLAPEFPENLPGFFALNASFGLGLVLVAALLLRQLRFGRGETLALTAMFALQPLTVYWTASLLSDVFFGALALGAAVAAKAAFRNDGFDWRRWSLATALLWAAVLTRSLGTAFVAGLVVWALWRRRPLAAAVAASAALPAVLATLQPASGVAVPAQAEAGGFEQTLAYYLSYGQFWRLCVPDLDTFFAQTSFQLAEAVKHPAVAVFGLPAAGFSGLPLTMLAVTLSVGVLKGVIAGARRRGLHPIHLAAMAYLPLTLIWNYALLERFWLPFTPLLLAGAWTEIAGLAAGVRAAFERGKPIADRCAAAGLGAALAATIAFAGYRQLVAIPRSFERLAAARAELRDQKLEAYDWLRRSVAAEPDGRAARVVSFEDPAVYLRTGLRGMRPMAFSTAAFFQQDEAVFEHDLERMGDVADALDARYWLVSADDFATEIDPERARAGQASVLAGRAPDFTSSDGRVLVYRLDGRQARSARAEPPAAGLE